MPSISSAACRLSFAGGAVLVAALGGLSALPAQQFRNEPLPIQTLVRDSRPIATHALSPDAQWVAIQYSTMDETLTGPPPVIDDGYWLAFRVSLVNTRTQEVIELGDRGTITEKPSWSADGQYLIYVQIRNGHEDLLMWNRRTRESKPLSFIAEQRLKIEDDLQWLPDGHRFIVSASVKRPELERDPAIGQGPKLPVLDYDFPQFPAARPGEAVVQVLKTAALKNAETPPKSIAPRAAESGMIPPPVPSTFLVVVDIQQQTVERLTDTLNLGSYWPSPDGRSLAYMTFKGWTLPEAQRVHDLVVLDLQTRKQRVIARDLPIWWGNTITWSPDSRHLAYLTASRVGGGQAFVVSLEDGAVPRRLGDAQTPVFQRMDATGFNFRTQRALWDARGDDVYSISPDGELWRLNVRSGQAKQLSKIDGFEIQSILIGRNQPLPATGSVFVTARPAVGTSVGIFRVDLTDGTSRPIVQPSGMSTGGSYDVANSGDISIVMQSAQRPKDVWLLENTSDELRQVSQLGASIRRYPLASLQVIDYVSANGDHLHGALLLPPGHVPGRRYPMVVWVYGGRGGAESQNRFGLEDDSPFYNLQMFATRGYAVLFPEAPLRKGTPMKDLVATVIPAVDKAIALGYADPELLAVAGHSYGSYCSLALLAQTSHFKVGLISGMRDWDLFSAYLAGPRTSKSFGSTFQNGQGNIGGTLWDQQQRYVDNSPFFIFDKIQAPILMTQGSRDQLLAADKNYKALSALDKFVEYRIYEDEGHVLLRGVDVADAWQHQLDFLATHLRVTRDLNGAVVFDGAHAKRMGASK